MENEKSHARLDLAGFHERAPETTGALRAISKGVRDGGLEPALVELVEVRASQINGCAFCLNLHAARARRLGESEERLRLLCVWREAPIYTDRERAALAWTEALTLVAAGGVTDDVYAEARRHFSEKDLADLTSAIAVINAWNRIGVAYRWTPEIEGTR